MNLQELPVPRVVVLAQATRTIRAARGRLRVHLGTVREEVLFGQEAVREGMIGGKALAVAARPTIARLTRRRTAQEVAAVDRMPVGSMVEEQTRVAPAGVVAPGAKVAMRVVKAARAREALVAGGAPAAKAETRGEKVAPVREARQIRLGAKIAVPSS
jgi:hypothetical protein